MRQLVTFDCIISYFDFNISPLHRSLLSPLCTMGFEGLVSADKLGAVYTKEHQLVLSAEGTVQAATYGFHFERLQWLGGLKFALEAWTEPLLG